MRRDSSSGRQTPRDSCPQGFLPWEWCSLEVRAQDWPWGVGKWLVLTLTVGSTEPRVVPLSCHRGRQGGGCLSPSLLAAAHCHRWPSPETLALGRVLFSATKGNTQCVKLPADWGLEHRHLLLDRVWRLEAQGQGVIRVVPSASGRICSRFLSLACRHPVSPHIISPRCVSVSESKFLLFKRTQTYQVRAMLL